MPPLPRAAPLLLTLAVAAALPAPAAAAPSRVRPVLHLSAGTGACPEARSPDRKAGNPCWLLFGVQGGGRWRALEAGVVYEGREPLDLLSAFQLRPPAATVLGGTVAWVAEPGARWRLSLAGEGGWRHYVSFSGSGLTGRQGAADTAYLGATGRLGFGLRPHQGRSDRMEVTLAFRSDLRTATDEVGGIPWRAGGWSITMGVGLVSEW
jgi:hypothetical protein